MWFFSTVGMWIELVPLVRREENDSIKFDGSNQAIPFRDVRQRSIFAYVFLL